MSASCRGRSDGTARAGLLMSAADPKQTCEEPEA